MLTLGARAVGVGASSLFLIIGIYVGANFVFVRGQEWWYREDRAQFHAATTKLKNEEREFVAVEARLESLATTIEAGEKSLKAFQEEFDAIERRKSKGLSVATISTYNEAVAYYNNEVPRYNALLQQHRELFAEYKQRIEEHNRQVDEANKLAAKIKVYILVPRRGHLGRAVSRSRLSE